MGHLSIPKGVIMNCFDELTALIRQTHGEPSVEVNSPPQQSATWLLGGQRYGYNFTGDGLHRGFHVFAPGCHIKIDTTRPGWISLPVMVTHLIYCWDINWDASVTKIAGGWP